MAALFDEYSSSSSSSGDEKDKKETDNFEMDFIPKSMITFVFLTLHRETLGSSL